MITIDGKPLDLSNPQGITFKPGGYIEQVKDGVTLRIGHQSWCASNQVLTSNPPQYQKCNCGFEP